MKRMFFVVAAVALVAVIAVYATQDTALTMKEVRDPRQLKTWLEANAQDAETRLVAAGATATSAIVLTNSSNAGTCSISAFVDKSDNAGDYVKLLVADGGTLTLQSDIDAQGTLATKLSIDNAGIITLKGSGSIDNTTDTAVMNLTETTVKVTGAFQVTGAVTMDGKLTTTPISNANVTNGQAVTVSGVINLLTAVGEVNSSGTATITLANPSAAGQWCILYNGVASTNHLAVAASGNYVGTALDLTAGQSAIIFAPTATTWAGHGD